MNDHNHNWYNLPQETTIGTATTSKCTTCKDVKYTNTYLNVEQVIHKDDSGNVSVSIKPLVKE